MTISNFSYKPDWASAQARWDAFWDMSAIDRPCMPVHVRRSDARETRMPEARSIEDKWMNPECVLAGALQSLEQNQLCGEAVPVSGYFMAGTTNGCNGNLFFHDGGISIRPSMSDMSQPLDWHPGHDDPWRPKVDAICNYLLDEAPGRFMMAYPDQYPPIDLLNMIRGNEAMLVDMAMEPELCQARLHELRAMWLDNFEHFRLLVDARQGDAGVASWTGIWGRRFFKPAQADMAVCISPEMFEQFVLPELDLWGERYERLEFHTCGYKQHLELCLSRPYIRIIQYAPNWKEPQNGPAHLDFYRRVQQAGRCLEICVPPENVEFVIRRLRPEGLCVFTTANSVAEADELLANAVRWAGTHASRLT